MEKNQENLANPQASTALAAEDVKLTTSSKLLLLELENEIKKLDWQVRDLAPLERAPELAGPAVHLLAAGGKRVRPLLVNLIARCLDMPFDHRMATAALAAELVHSATLLHDDVLDEAKTRRGRIAAHLKFNAHKAILSGDALLCKAMADIAQLREPIVLEKLALTLRDIVEGECLQADLVGSVHSELEPVLEICRRKTGALFGWAAWVPAYYGKVNYAAELEQFGLHLGLAFQLLDDLLDWNSEKTGKPRYQDLREAKLNSVGVLLMHESQAARSICADHFTDLNGFKEVKAPEELGKALSGLPEYRGACDKIYARAENETQFALANLERLPESAWKELSKQVTLKLLSRLK